MAFGSYFRVLIWPLRKYRKIVFAFGLYALFYLFLYASLGHYGTIVPLLQVNVSYVARLLNCDALADSKAPQHARHSILTNIFSAESALRRAENCDTYFDLIDVLALKANKNNTGRNGPRLAFSHLVKKRVGTLELFLALYFRPGDSHCIHVAAGVRDAVWEAVFRIAHCYHARFPRSRVFLTRVRLPVVWRDRSMLEADFTCMRQLKKDLDWDYYINLGPGDLPLVPIEDLRERLRSAEGADVVDVNLNSEPERQIKVMTVRR